MKSKSRGSGRARRAHKRKTPKKTASYRVPQRYLRPRWKYLSQDNAGTLYIDDISVKLLAKKFGTPLYVLIEKEIRSRLKRFMRAFPYPKLRPQYAGKINANLEILRIVREEGFDLDASTVGEIILGLLADFEPKQITFTNLYKTEQDIIFATKVGVMAITADSIEELRRMEAAGQRIKQKIRAFIRLNPLITLGKYTTRDQQYGIPANMAKKAVDFAIKSKWIDLIGFHFHGSYIYNPKVYTEAAKRLLKWMRYCLDHNCKIKYIDLGGGFPYDYGGHEFFDPEDMGEEFVDDFEKLLAKHGLSKPTLIFEPGKFICANAGVGLVTVVSVKQVGQKKMAITDGSTYSFLPDPMIYRQYYDILPATKMTRKPTEKYAVTGRSCDVVDKLGLNRSLPKLEEDDILAITDCGAYSSVLASNFNTLKRAPMVLITIDGKLKLIRRRDRYSEMFAPELDVLKYADPHELKNLYLLSVNVDKIWKGTPNGKASKKPVAGV